MEDIDQDYRTKTIILADKETTKSPKKRKKINLKIVLVFFLIGFITPIMAGYIYRAYNKTADKIYNSNMNVQLDMGSDMILPINTVYTDETGSHIIIEDVAAKDSKLTIELYDDEHNKLDVEKKMIECPDKKCTRHYDLVFSLNKDSDYYILQMDNNESVKNVEIDGIYFK